MDHPGGAKFCSFSVLTLLLESVNPLLPKDYTYLPNTKVIIVLFGSTYVAVGIILK